MKQTIKSLFLTSAFILGFGGVAFVGAGVYTQAIAQEKTVSSDVYSAQKRGSLYDVVLYGHKFTLDSSQATTRTRKWEDVGYLVPEILPSIQGDADKRDLKAIIYTLSDIAIVYRDLSNKELIALATRLEEMGHIGLIPGYDTGVWDLTPRAVDPDASPEDYVSRDSAERRIRHIENGVRDLIRDKQLFARIDAYNAEREQTGKDGVAPEFFLNAELFRKYSQAAHGLKAMVFGSPQMQKYLDTEAPAYLSEKVRRGLL